MKRLNQILFLSSFAIVSGAFGMIAVSDQRNKWFVELNDTVVKNHVGDKTCYYPKYCSINGNNGTVLFPDELTDSLSIEYCGDKRFFVTSATVRNMGKVYKILNSEITQLAIVRGFNPENNYCVNVYIGLYADNSRVCGCDRIYPGYVMALQIEEESCSANRYYLCSYSKLRVGRFDAQDIEMEVKKYLRLKDCDWKNPVIRRVIEGLLGRRVRDFDFESRVFCPREIYLT